ncbi:uncharacterized protein LOC102808126 [Saccoglossus kowalevskii]
MTYEPKVNAITESPLKIVAGSDAVLECGTDAVPPSPDNEIWDRFLQDRSNYTQLDPFYEGYDIEPVEGVEQTTTLTVFDAQGVKTYRCQFGESYADIEVQAAGSGPATDQNSCTVSVGMAALFTVLLCCSVTGNIIAFFIRLKRSFSKQLKSISDSGDNYTTLSTMTKYAVHVYERPTLKADENAEDSNYTSLSPETRNTKSTYEITDSYNLVLTDVKLADEGEYRCMVLNLDPQSKSANLGVWVPAKEVLISGEQGDCKTEFPAPGQIMSFSWMCTVVNVVPSATLTWNYIITSATRSPIQGDIPYDDIHIPDTYSDVQLGAVTTTQENGGYYTTNSLITFVYTSGQENMTLAIQCKSTQDGLVDTFETTTQPIKVCFFGHEPLVKAITDSSLRIIEAGSDAVLECGTDAIPPFPDNESWKWFLQDGSNYTQLDLSYEGYDIDPVEGDEQTTTLTVFDAQGVNTYRCQLGESYANIEVQATGSATDQNSCNVSVGMAVLLTVLLCCSVTANVFTIVIKRRLKRSTEQSMSNSRDNYTTLYTMTKDAVHVYIQPTLKADENVEDSNFTSLSPETRNTQSTYEIINTTKNI